MAGPASVSAVKSIGSGAGLSQTGIIFGMLLVGFFIFITLKGQLSAWGQLFTTSDASSTANTNLLGEIGNAPTQSSSSSGSGGSGGTIGDVASIAEVAAIA